MGNSNESIDRKLQDLGVAEGVEVGEPIENQEVHKQTSVEELAKEYVVDWSAVGIKEGQIVGPTHKGHLFGPSPDLRVSVDYFVSKKGMTPKEAVMSAIPGIEMTGYAGVTGGALEALATLIVRKGEYHDGEFQGNPIVTMSEQDKIDALMLASEYSKLKTMKQIFGVGDAPWADRLPENERRQTLQEQLSKVERFQEGLKALAAKSFSPEAPAPIQNKTVDKGLVDVPSVHFPKI